MNVGSAHVEHARGSGARGCFEQEEEGHATGAGEVDGRFLGGVSLGRRNDFVCSCRYDEAEYVPGGRG